jgi:superfamily II DNA or RNA helicase
MKVIRRDPAKGYIDTNFWLPKTFCNVEGVKNALTFDFSEKGKPNVLVLWKETPSHLIVPREFWDTTSSDFTFPIVDCRPIAYQRVEIESKIRLDHLPNLQGVLTPTGDDVQRHAMEALLPSRGGILQLACGKGKTVVALDFIARKKVPTLIVVDTTQLIEQWLTSINMFLNIPDGVGMMGDGEFRWHHPVVVATYHTLAARAATLPEEIRRWFGMIIWDEAHHVAAPTFARSADLFFGHRFGLTATPDRSDGQHVIYNFHIGRVLFKDLTQKLKPKIFFKWTGLSLDPQDSYVQVETRDKNGELHIGKTAVFFGQWRERLRTVLDEVQLAITQGRKIIVLSQSVDEAVNLLALWNGKSDNDLYTDVPKPTERDVNETIMPAGLSTEARTSLVKKLAELRNLLKDPALNPVKRQTFEDKVKNIKFRLEQDRVSKKIEGLHRKRQKAYLKELLEMPSTGGLMIYKVEASARTAMLRSKQVTFAIMKYGKEGLDEPALDTVIVSTPISDRNTLQQIMGRPSREKEGKKGPVVVFLEDNVGPMIGMCVELRSHLKSWPIEEGGPYDYELIGNPATTNRRQSWSNQLRVSGS